MAAAALPRYTLLFHFIILSLSIIFNTSNSLRIVEKPNDSSRKFLQADFSRTALKDYVDSQKPVEDDGAFPDYIYGESTSNKDNQTNSPRISSKTEQSSNPLDDVENTTFLEINTTISTSTINETIFTTPATSTTTEKSTTTKRSTTTEKSTLGTSTTTETDDNDPYDEDDDDDDDDDDEDFVPDYIYGDDDLNQNWSKSTRITSKTTGSVNSLKSSSSSPYTENTTVNTTNSTSSSTKADSTITTLLPSRTSTDVTTTTSGTLTTAMPAPDKLSKVGIGAIVICCIVALVSAILVAMFVKKRFYSPRVTYEAIHA